MSNLYETGYFAIDGGGTRSRFAFVRGKERLEFESGPANVFSNFEGAVSQVLSGMQVLADRAGCPLEHLQKVPGFVGLAGVVDQAIAERLRAALPLENVLYADDRPAALQGAFGARDGFVAHCGTGSFFAARVEGQVRLAGGWGAALGDAASAQWVGRKALALALDRVDGLIASSSVTTRILDKFGCPSGILRFSSTATPGDYGTLAPIVTEQATAGDDAARAIMREGAAYLSQTLDRLGWQSQHSLCLTGGIAPHFKPYLPQEKQARLTNAEGVPLDGALDLARHYAEGAP